MPDAKWSITGSGRGMNIQQSHAMFRLIRRPEAASLEDIYDMFFSQPGIHGVDFLMHNDPFEMELEDAQSWADVERDGHTVFRGRQNDPGADPFFDRTRPAPIQRCMPPGFQGAQQAAPSSLAARLHRASEQQQRAQLAQRQQQQEQQQQQLQEQQQQLEEQQQQQQEELEEEEQLTALDIAEAEAQKAFDAWQVLHQRVLDVGAEQQRQHTAAKGKGRATVQPSYAPSCSDDEADRLQAQRRLEADSAGFDAMRCDLAARHPGGGSSGVHQHQPAASDIMGESASEDDSRPSQDDLSSAAVSAATTDNDHDTLEDNIDSMPSYDS